jgi:hypothetical protein
MEWLKVKALSSTPVSQKKKKSPIDNKNIAHEVGMVAHVCNPSYLGS